MDMPENFDSESNFLSEPGTYHVVVLHVDEQPVGKNQQLLDGFRVDFAVLDGTTPGQRDKQVELMFFRPKMTDKNNGEFAKRKQGRFALATGIIPRAEPGQRVTVDLQQAAGRQLVIEVERQTDQQTGQPTKFLQLAWANIWHVDDPAVAKIPKDATALSLLPASLRKKPSDFEKPKPAANTKPDAGAGTAKPATPAGGVNLDDL